MKTVQLSALAFLSTALGADVSVCTSTAFAMAPSVPLSSSLSLRSLVVGSNACFEVTASVPSAKWVAIGFASSGKMVNSPATNAVVYQTPSTSVQLYKLGDYDSSGITREQDQSSIAVASSSFVNGQAKFTFQRTLAAKSTSDIALAENVATNVIWAYGESAWPAIHSSRGASRVVLSASTAPATVLAAASTVVTTYTTVIVAAAFVLMLILGLFATHAGELHFINQVTLLAPPKFQVAILQTLADFKIGEAIVAAVYIATLVVVGVSIQHQFDGATANRMTSLITGHFTMVNLMLLLLPVARGKHWEVVFGISHERILKFHRALGRLCVVFAIIHLIVNAVKINVTIKEAYGTQEVIPLYGFLAFLAFASMGLIAIDPIRRRFYEVFYYYHRVMAVVGIVFAMLHSKTVVYGMIFPLVIYGLSAIYRLRAFFNAYKANFEIQGEDNINFILPSTAQTKHWAKTMNPCSFFWVCVPSVSKLEWHPFSAIVNPEQDTIGFCMKAKTKGSFTDKLIQAARASDGSELTLLVDGPYGNPSVDIAKYDHIVLICGGIGVTPMLSLMNETRDKADGTRQKKIEMHWVVRDPKDLLKADRLMYPLPHHVQCKFYASTSSAPSAVLSASGEHVQYSSGKPIMEEIINNERFLGQKACVLACGPPGLVLEAQRHANIVGLDFHKEVFLF
ncbi:transmembrane protein [Thraustotheca clavata]|uniref:Transmembrane protein n=1 Tax=Thraustotheca clavata TaxID=74557 RepID=A0A1V9Z1R8_9STRA|nr:transmembrane protein [Thraustotheca clavata]